MSEYKEEKALEILEECGRKLRELRNNFYAYCSENEYVKGSTILSQYAKIEEKQREYEMLNNNLIELEKA